MGKKDSNNPFVSVIIATYNEPPDFITKSLRSIMEQSYPHLEIIVADDSTDKRTKDAIDKLASEDNRIQVIRQEQRMGFVNALNNALHQAKGELIARMDGDDISSPNRISLQVEYAREHPDIDLFGSSMYIINEEGDVISERNYPTTKWGIYKMFLYRSPFSHPTVMLKRDIIDNGFYYNPNYKRAEDVDFYIRLWQKGYHFGNLPDKLLKYRVVDDMGRKRTKEQWIYNHKARKKIIWRKPIFTVLSYIISLIYIHIPKRVVSSYYKKENKKRTYNK